MAKGFDKLAGPWFEDADSAIGMGIDSVFAIGAEADGVAIAECWESWDGHPGSGVGYFPIGEGHQTAVRTEDPMVSGLVDRLFPRFTGL